MTKFPQTTALGSGSAPGLSRRLARENTRCPPTSTLISVQCAGPTCSEAVFAVHGNSSGPGHPVLFANLAATTRSLLQAPSDSSLAPHRGHPLTPHLGEPGPWAGGGCRQRPVRGGQQPRHLNAQRCGGGLHRHRQRARACVFISSVSRLLCGGSRRNPHLLPTREPMGARAHGAEGTLSRVPGPSRLLLGHFWSLSSVFGPQSPEGESRRCSERRLTGCRWGGLQQIPALPRGLRLLAGGPQKGEEPVLLRVCG